MKNIFQEKPEQNHDGTANLVRLIQDLPNDQVLQTFNYAWIDSDKQLKEHKHDDCVEYYLFLGGAGDMTIGKEKFEVTKGDFVTVELGELHTLINTSEEELEFLTLRALIK